MAKNSFFLCALPKIYSAKKWAPDINKEKGKIYSYNARTDIRVPLGLDL